MGWWIADHQLNQPGRPLDHQLHWFIGNEASMNCHDVPRVSCLEFLTALTLAISSQHPAAGHVQDLAGDKRRFLGCKKSDG